MSERMPTTTIDAPTTSLYPGIDQKLVDDVESAFGPTTQVSPETIAEIDSTPTEYGDAPTTNIEPGAEAPTTNVEPIDDRELSPTGSRIARAASRVKAFLEKRAMNKAHGQALKEDALRTEDITHDNDHEQALNMDDAFELNKKIKERIASIGSSSLNVLRTSGEITLGVSVLTGEAATKAVKDAAERAKASVVARRDKIVSFVDNAGDAVVDKVDSVFETIADKKDSFVNFLRENRDKALARKAKRREMYASMRNKTSEVWQNANTRRRVIGGKALGFMARARAAGSAAASAGKQTWEEQGAQNDL